MTAPPTPAALPLSLLLLRLGVALAMIFWVADKFVNPAHAGSVFAHFYGIGGVGETAVNLLGVVQLVIVLAFTIGAFKTVSYGAVLAMHASSTLVSWRQYLEPFDNMLFLAAWPMLAALIALFLLRDHDRLLSAARPRRLAAT